MTATATATHPLEAIDLTPRCETIMDGVSEHGAPATHTCQGHNQECAESFIYICADCIATIRRWFPAGVDVICAGCKLSGPLEKFIWDIRSIA